MKRIVSPLAWYPDLCDKIAGRWLFEIGGRGKGFSQIKDVPDSFVANDGVEVGSGNKIPLWLFGFLYLKERWNDEHS